MSAPERGWRDALVVLATAVVTLVGTDVAFRQVSKPRYVREVREAMAELEHEDPTVLALGSSHARTFATMDGILRSRTGGRERVMSVPLEWGKFRGYEWVLHNRIVPLLDEKNPDGSKKRPSLKKFILTTAWWDTCWTDGDPPVFNLPSRAWTFGNFVDDVLKNGITDHNRNYPTAVFGELFHGSILVSDRGQHHLPEALHDTIKPRGPEEKQADFDERLKSWKKIIARAKLNMGHRDELASVDRMLKWAQDRGYDVTLLVYPLMPVTVEERSKVEVLIPYAESMRQVAAHRGVRFIEATFDAGMVDSDFQPDFDHLTPAGHVKFSEWLLDGPMSFLVEEGSRKSSATGTPAPAPEGPSP